MFIPWWLESRVKDFNFLGLYSLCSIEVTSSLFASRASEPSQESDRDVTCRRSRFGGQSAVWQEV